MKTCKDCKELKEITEFYGVQNECKDCTKRRVRSNRLAKVEQYREYDRERQRSNYRRIFKNRYYNMRARVEGRLSRRYASEGRGIASQEEFLRWCYTEPQYSQFKLLHKEWKNSGFTRVLTPSIDRINNTGGYTLDNIQWLTVGDNNRKFTH